MIWRNVMGQRAGEIQWDEECNVCHKVWIDCTCKKQGCSARTPE